MQKEISHAVVYWLLSWERDTASRVQILDKPVCISHIAKTFGESMILIVLSSAMGKY